MANKFAKFGIFEVYGSEIYGPIYVKFFTAQAQSQVQVLKQQVQVGVQVPDSQVQAQVQVLDFSA